MTPLYDVISAVADHRQGRQPGAVAEAKLAMALRSKSAHYVLPSIHARHWQVVAQKSGVPDVWDGCCAWSSAWSRRWRPCTQDCRPTSLVALQRRGWCSTVCAVSLHAVAPGRGGTLGLARASPRRPHHARESCP